MDADATHITSCASLDGMLKPKGVVLVGASDRSAFSRTAYAAGKLTGFDDRIFLVSRPRRSPRPGTAQAITLISRKAGE